MEVLKKLIKKQTKALKSMAATSALALQLAQCKHKFVKVDNSFHCGACTGKNGTFCGRQGARHACELCATSNFGEAQKSKALAERRRPAMSVDLEQLPPKAPKE